MTIALTVRGRDSIVMATDSCLTLDASKGIYGKHVQKSFLLPSPYNMGFSFAGYSNITLCEGIEVFIYRFFKLCLAETHIHRTLDDIAMLLIDRIRSAKTSPGALHALVAGYVTVDNKRCPKLWQLSTDSEENISFLCAGANCIGEPAVFNRIEHDLRAGTPILGHNDVRCFTVNFDEFSVDDSIDYCNRVIELTEAEFKNVSSPNHILLITPTSSQWILSPCLDMGLDNPLA